MKSNLRKDFRTAAPLASSAAYAFDYAAEVADFHAAFPEWREKVFFVDMTPTSASLMKGALSDAGIAEAEKTITEGALADIIKKMQPIHQSFTVRFPDKKAYVVVDRAGKRRDMPKLMGAAASADLENYNTFEHEAGHRATYKGLPPAGSNENLREGAADAYAAIRHIQRFGVDEHLKASADLRAVELVFRPDEGRHFTTPVIDAIIAAAGSIGFNGVKPKHAARIAIGYAQLYALEAGEVRSLAAEFKSVAGKLGTVAAGDLDPLRELALELLTTSSPAAYKWGRRAFEAILDGKAEVNGTVIKPKGAEWDELRDEIAARAAEFQPKKPAPLRPGPK